MAGLKVNAVRLQQHGRTLYLFPMNSTQLNRLCYATPRAEDTPAEIQRIVNERRAKDIGEYLKDPSVVLPNAIVISLDNDVKIHSTGNGSEAVIEFPEEEGKFGYILDGQHRLRGFKFADGVSFDLPVVALHGVDESLRGKIFADINSKQEKVSDVHLLELYYQIGGMKPDESGILDVIHGLERDEDSPLKGLVKVRDDQKGRRLTNKFIKRVFGPHLVSGGTLAKLNPQTQTTILKEYLRGVEQLWPSAWSDSRGFLLIRPFGMEIIAAIFKEVKFRVDLNYGKQYTAANFKRALEPLTNTQLRTPDGDVPLDWSKGPLGKMSSAAGRGAIIKKLKDTLAEADRTEDSETR